MFCDGCYVQLPLTGSPGYGMCPRCRVKVQRAIPGFYGEQAGAGWTRRGRTFEESDAEYAAKLGRNVRLARVLSWADFVKDNETGTFTVCALEGKAHLIARVSVSEHSLRILADSIKAGKVVLRTSFHPYPTYPVIYNRLFIVLSDGPQPGSFDGILVESATDFTEANFQQWAVTLRGTRRLCVHLCSDTGDVVTSAEVEIAPEVVDMVVQATDQANEYHSSVPKDQEDFKEAAQTFFRDHPEPFLFSDKGNTE